MAAKIPRYFKEGQVELQVYEKNHESTLRPSYSLLFLVSIDCEKLTSCNSLPLFLSCSQWNLA
jgi:hypothetical protein